MVGTGRPEPDICYDCEQKITKAKKDNQLSELAKLPLEERVARIEEWIYDGEWHGECSHDLRF